MSFCILIVTVSQTAILESDRTEGTPAKRGCRLYTQKMTMIGPAQHSEIIFKVFFANLTKLVVVPS